MKLYIWTNFNPDWSGGLAFAIAKDEKDARQQIVKDRGYEPTDWGDLEVRPLTRRVARSVSGGS